MDDLLQSEMILLHPELVGNMVSQWKADPLAAPEGSFVGDRLVARPGEEGRELREQGKREGWLTRREPHDLAIGMWSRYGDAVVDMRNYLWEAATGLKSFSAGYGEGESRRIPEGYRPAEALGIPAGNYSRDELYALLVESTGVVSKNFTPYAGNTAEQQITGTDTMIEIDRLKGLARDHGLTDDPRTWPEEARQMGRDAFEAAINNPWSRFGTALAQVSTGQQVVVPREFTVTDYNRDLAPYWGELDYEAPVPPVLEDVPVGATDETYRLTVDPKDLVVIDGDTVAIEYDPAGRVGNQLAQAVADGPFTKTSDDAQRIRLIGVNAAERNEVTIVEGDTSYADQTNALQDIVRRAESIDFVVFDTEAFGTLQTVEADEVRWLMVMYVDGQPLWDPEVFTSVSPGGAGLGGNGVLNLDIKLREGV